MNVKIDTKEKFSVISPIETEITANMAAGLKEILESHLQKDIPHIILNMRHVALLDEKAGEMIALTQQHFYENNHSFVVCALQEAVENSLDEHQLLETMNVTPTESEAWDIVQMEEIERELLSDFPDE
jgi:anti-anti-sigma factor